MKFTIKEFSKMIGISVSKIRYYEKKGIYSHHREENGYRIFSEEDAYFINDFIAINGRGYSIADSAKLLQGQSLSEAIESLTNNAGEMDMQILLLKEKKRYALETAQTFQLLINDKNFIRRVALPDYMIHPASEKGDFRLAQINADTRYQWQKLFPFTRYIGFGESRKLVTDSLYIDCGHSVSAEHFTELGYQTDQSVVCYRMGDCICFYAEEDHVGRIGLSAYPHVLQYLADHKLRAVDHFIFFYFMMPIHGMGENSGVIALPVETEK